MQPSSLVFLVIVGVWAAFLLQLWVRRREDLGTARTADRFSEAMRVLEMRGGAEPRTSTASRPEAGRPLAARAATASSGASHPVHEAPSVAAPDPHSPTGPARPVRATRPPVTAGRRPGRLMRKVRGLSFLATLIAVPTTIVLSLANILLWVSVAISGAAFVLCLAWLRTAARREQAARRAAARRARGRAERGAASAGRSAARPGTRPVSRSATPAVPAAQASAPAPSVVEGAAEQPAFVDAWATGRELTPDVEQAAVARAARADDDWSADLPAGSTWSPVNVPLPTYALKDQARPRSVVPAETTAPTPAPADDLFDQQAPARRAVGD